METRYFDRSPEESRQESVRQGREAVLGGQTYSDAWKQNPDLLADANAYTGARRSVSSVISGLFFGGATLTDAAEKTDRFLEDNLRALEEQIARIETGLTPLGTGEVAGLETWSPRWPDAQDLTYEISEVAFDGSYPSPCQTDLKTGALTLPALFARQVYGAETPGRLRIIGSIGGEAPVYLDGYKPFSPARIPLWSETKIVRGDIPWLPPGLGRGAALRLRLDLPTPTAFTRVTVGSGGHNLAAPGYVSWYPSGGEGLSSLNADPFFLTSGWVLGGGCLVIPASGSTGPDAPTRLGNLTKLLRCVPGQAQYYQGGDSYTQSTVSWAGFTPPSGGGALRLASLWRGLGDLVDGEHITLGLRYYSVVTGSPSGWVILSEEEYTLKEGLPYDQKVTVGEFLLSRYLSHAPVGAVSGVIYLCRRQAGRNLRYSGNDSGGDSPD